MQISNTVVVALIIICAIMYIRDMRGVASAVKQSDAEEVAADNINSNGNTNKAINNIDGNNNYVNKNEYVDSDGMIDEKKNNFQQHAYLENLRKNRKLRVLDAQDIIDSPAKRVNILFCTS